MAKFMLLYLSPIPARYQLANTTPEQMKAGMGAWMQWADKAGDAIVDLGSPLAAATRAGSGPAPTGEITGYSIMEAESAEALSAILDGHPHLGLAGTSIEVLEMLSMPGM